MMERHSHPLVPRDYQRGQSQSQSQSLMPSFGKGPGAKGAAVCRTPARLLFTYLQHESHVDRRLLLLAKQQAAVDAQRPQRTVVLQDGC